MLPVSAEETFICVWRNPERTMTRLFPDAKDYRTVIKDISKEQLTEIEKRIGTEVLPGQRKQFQFFEMINASGEIIGYTSAITQKGEFGAIEFVFGMNSKYEIIGIYIQRARERNREFKAPDFLNSFVGKGVSTVKTIIDPLGDNGNIGTKAVVGGLVKELTAFDELVVKVK